MLHPDICPEFLSRHIVGQQLQQPEKTMAPHSSTLAWRIPGTGEPGGLPSMGSHRVGHDGSDLAAAAAATTAANDLIFVELDGGLCSLFYRALFLVLFLLDFRVIS